MNDNPMQPRQRLRLTYRHGPELRYLSNLDLIRLFERALRRARLPIAYSQGFNAHPRLKVAAPLPVGFAGDREMVDFFLTEILDPADFCQRLAQQLPAGIAPIAVETVPVNTPPLASLLRAAHYFVEFSPAPAPDALRAAVQALLAQEQVIRARMGKGRRLRQYDLRPLIMELRVCGEPSAAYLEMTLAARDGATGRPEEVLAALGYEGHHVQIRRSDMVFGQPDSTLDGDDQAICRTDPGGNSCENARMDE
jgi:radical SAM-linked protein